MPVISRTVWSVGVLIVGYLLFNLSAGYRLRFQLRAAGCMVVFAVGAWLLVDRVPWPFVRALAIGLLFVVFAVSAKWRWDPFPADVGESSSGISPPANIIDFSWFAILGATLAGIVFVQDVPPLSEELPQAGLPVPYYESYLENVRFLFGRVTTALVALASVLAAAMGILWAGEVWRGKPEKDYVKTTHSAVKMVVAFFTVVTMVVIAVLHPLYVRMVYVAELLAR